MNQTMTPLLDIVLYMTVLTFFAILLGAFLRNREWTAEGVKAGLSNRDQLPEATPLGGRAARAAGNTIEALVLFAPLAMVAHAIGRDAETLLGAQIFFWARVAYWPVYIAGIVYLRSVIWIVGVLGLAMMLLKLI
jgi:uncharacterized MAPEG superfamily protein